MGAEVFSCLLGINLGIFCPRWRLIETGNLYVPPHTRRSMLFGVAWDGGANHGRPSMISGVGQMTSSPRRLLTSCVAFLFPLFSFSLSRYLFPSHSLFLCLPLFDLVLVLSLLFSLSVICFLYLSRVFISFSFSSCFLLSFLLILSFSVFLFNLSFSFSLFFSFCDL